MTKRPRTKERKSQHSSFRPFSPLLCLYNSDKHLRHVTAFQFSVAIPSVCARRAASLSRELHMTIPSPSRACKSRFCLLSRGIWIFQLFMKAYVKIQIEIFFQLCREVSGTAFFSRMHSTQKHNVYNPKWS